jgi:hypothetical protein
MDYEPFKDLPGVKNMFMTERGSTYALFDNQTSQRNRSGERHEDKSVGLQPRSGKTVFLDLDSMNRIGSAFQREDMATRFVPVLDKDGKPTGKAKLELMQDYTYRPSRQIAGKLEMGEPRTLKAGTVLSEVPYSTKPVKGMYPIEVMRSESPLGEKGRGIHFGSRITEVLEKLDKQIQRGQAAVERGAARGGGAYGGAMPPNIGNTTFEQYMKMNHGGFVERQDPKAGNWKFI